MHRCEFALHVKDPILVCIELAGRAPLPVVVSQLLLAVTHELVEELLFGAFRLCIDSMADGG